MNESTIGTAVPAGWYADPSGLPQLRWWDSTAWSEHVHHPEFAGESTVAATAASTAPSASTATSSVAVLERTTVVDDAESNSFLTYVSEHNAVEWDPSMETMQTGPARIGAFMSSSPLPIAAEEELGKARAYTSAVWFLAAMPLFQIALTFGIVALLGNVDNFRLALGIVVVPYLWSIALAYTDRKTLINSGHFSTAHWAWSMISPLLYLAIRTVRVHRLARRGSAPLWTWLLLTGAQIAAAAVMATAIAGILTSLFSVEVANTVEDSVALQGVTLNVECPADAPLTVGSEFQCAATHDTGQDYFVNVHVDDVLGGFTWQMTDDGNEAFASR
jgi:hypothetical protein